LLSLILFAVVLLAAGGPADRKRSHRLLCLVLALGFVFGAVAFGNGWHAKGQASTGAGADSGRHVRAQEAMRLIDAQPVFGVGPGRYTIALESVQHSDLLPAHNMVLHDAAEAGVLAGVLTTLLLAALALRAWRGGAETTAVFVAPVLFFVLDAYPYVFPTGLAVSALWLAMVFSAREHVNG
jgi:O-antigen ligase